uniref:Uncharacterized protein n=1 Tax=Brassica oleracea TaxID=3712 RepID=A0A3P6G4A8_BRAOL|nr:unnamed protein product [Brassica oleracea]
MRSESINHSFLLFQSQFNIKFTSNTFTYESPLPVGRLVVRLAGKVQVCTQRSWKRPYGVGLLVGGLDESGAHLYYNCPSGNYFKYQVFAIGSLSQAAKTYLERRFELQRVIKRRSDKRCYLGHKGIFARRKHSRAPSARFLF